MARITITENGRETIVTDIAPYRAERDAVVAKLRPIFDDFEQGPVEALASREPEIVELANRYYELANLIERFDVATVRRANILAGWEIVKRHRAGGE